MSWHLTVGETALAGTGTTLAAAWFGYRAQRFVARFNRDTQRERARADRNWKKKEEVYSSLNHELYKISHALTVFIRGDTSPAARTSYLATGTELLKVIPDFQLFAPDVIYLDLEQRNEIVLKELATLARKPSDPTVDAHLITKAKQAQTELDAFGLVMRDDLKDSD